MMLTLASERISLRPPRLSDKQDRLETGTDPEFARMVGEIHVALDSDLVDRWYTWLEIQPYGWVIDLGGRCIGEARLHSLNEQDRRARYAVGIFDPACRGMGIGKEATRLVLRYAFEVLGLHRVDLRVLEYNQRAIATYEQCGFVREGLERESACIEGVWHSDVMMSILEHEYCAVARERMSRS